MSSVPSGASAPVVEAADTNLYAAPAAEVAEAPRLRTDRPFFVVSRGKFVLMYAATFGLYGYYWWYMHWTRFRRSTGTPMWPVARAVFSIFFAHGLNAEIDHRLRKVAPYRWSPGRLATLYVIASIVGTVADRMASYNAGLHTTFLGVATLLPIGYSMAGSQQAANRAAGDPEALSNRHLTWANYLWVALGVVLWGAVMLGLYEIAIGLPAG